MSERWRHRLLALSVVLLVPTAARAQGAPAVTPAQPTTAPATSVPSQPASSRPTVTPALQRRLDALERAQAALKKQLDQRQKQPSTNTTTDQRLQGLSASVAELKGKLEQAAGGVRFSAFFDVTASTFRHNPNIFALGAFELDMEKGFAKHFQVAAALVFTDDAAELAVGFIDVHLFGGLIPARGRLFMESGMHLQVGRFDIPFGNDWQFFASKDRQGISAPLTTSFVMDGGYNDVGLRLLGSYSFFTVTLFALQGVGEGVALGGRVSVVPFNNPYTLKKQESQPLELGFSYLHDLSRDGDREARALAIDLEGKVGAAHLRAEYTRRDDDVAETRADGVHVTFEAELLGLFIEEPSTPLTLYARYDGLHREAAGTTLRTVHRLTGGASLDLFSVSLLKVEYAHFVRGDTSEPSLEGGAFFAQLVATF